MVIFLAILDIIVCIGLIVLVAIQQGGGGLGSLAGSFETFLDRGGADSFEDRLKKLTAVMAVAFAVLSIILYLMTGRQ